MDLIYLPEILTSGSFRNAQYRDYEQPWNRNYFDYGRTTYDYHHRQQQHRETLSSSSSKETCLLCKESKRRKLADYIRGKTRNNSCSEIHEEEEVEDDVNEYECKKEEAKQSTAAKSNTNEKNVKV